MGAVANISPQIALGILRARDLAEHYYGARLVTFTRTRTFTVATNAIQAVMTVDPRRIAYELALYSATAATASTCELGTPADVDAGNVAKLSIPGDATIIIARDWLTYLDAVCEPLSLKTLGAPSIVASVRETLLTPAPVDEF